MRRNLVSILSILRLYWMFYERPRKKGTITLPPYKLQVDRQTKYKCIFRTQGIFSVIHRNQTQKNNQSGWFLTHTFWWVRTREKESEHLLHNNVRCDEISPSIFIKLYRHRRKCESRSSSLAHQSRVCEKMIILRISENHVFLSMWKCFRRRIAYFYVMIT